MASRTPRRTAGHGVLLAPEVIADMRSHLPDVADRTVAAIIDEVPSYEGALSGSMGEIIRNAVQLALGGFLSLAGGRRGADPGTPTAPAMEGAYQLGRGEARNGRTTDALLQAYRIGARVAWREMSTRAVDGRHPGRPPGRLRGAGVRLHRRAVGGQRGGAHRRAGDFGPRARAVAGAAGGRPARRRPDRARAGGRRPRRVAGAADADRGDRARGAGAVRTRRAAGPRAPGRRPRRHARRPGAAARPGRPRPQPGRAAQRPGPRLHRRPGPSVAPGPGVVRPRPARPRRRPRRRHRGAPDPAGADRRPGGARRPARPRAGALGRPPSRRRREAHRHA